MRCGVIRNYLRESNLCTAGGVGSQNLRGRNMRPPVHVVAEQGTSRLRVQRV